MNIVKGVAELIRRTSSVQSGDIASGSPSERGSPHPTIRFSEVGDEAILNTLWERYKNVFDKVEKKKIFTIFLKQFLVVYRDWEPVDMGQFPADSSLFLPVGNSQVGPTVVGCFAGHPAEIIRTLTQELVRLAALVSEFNTTMLQSTTDHYVSSANTLMYEGLPVLDALALTSRSMHNCRVFAFYGGVQKLIALMKATVVQLKTVSTALSADEILSPSMVEKSEILQRILVHVVLILSSFIDLQFSLCKSTQINHGCWSFTPNSGASNEPSADTVSPLSESMVHWHQKAVVSVMEAGGLNWLVELLRVLRRLSMKEQWADLTLLYLALRNLRLSLADNPRGQNHFRSIGGLEVMLDGLGLSSINAPRVEQSSLEPLRNRNPFVDIFQLHILSLEVLREAVFGNLSNLQFLSENGRVHKFANSFCSLGFMLQAYKQHANDSVAEDDSKVDVSDDCMINDMVLHESSPETKVSGFYSPNWKEYVATISAVLCSFLLPLECTNLQKAHSFTPRNTLMVSSAYMELSIKWCLRVLLTIFPCIKACSNESQLPSQLRMFVYTLQHYVLFSFKKVLTLWPSLLDVFRAEGVWDFIFSEDVFYFGPISAELLGEIHPNLWGSALTCEEVANLTYTDAQSRSNETEALQIEAVALMEFAATLNGSSHNLAECSVMLEALEQSACNSGIASVLAKSLLQVLRLSPEKTVSSFKAIGAIPRVLKIASILALESKKPGTMSPDIVVSSEEVVSAGSPDPLTSLDTVHTWNNCVEILMELFDDYFSVTDDAKSYILCSSTCIDCLFDLFWEGGQKNRVLNYILDLMKVIPSSDEGHKAKQYLCSKYLETFTYVKEREKNFAEISVDLLVGMRDVMLADQMQYQALFRDGECFLHIVSLLNGHVDTEMGEKLVLNVLQTLTCLLSGNDASKSAFRALVGKGYQTLQSLLLDFCQWRSSEVLLNTLLDMLVDGKFDLKAIPVIKNEDVILLYLTILQKSSDSLRHDGLDLFIQLLKDSISNRDSCVRAGMLNLLLDWFPLEDDANIVLKITHLIHMTGGHSISGRDIRKIFALLRSEKVATQRKCSSLLLSSMLSMLNEKGPVAFFDFNGIDSGVNIDTPIPWPLSKGFSFSCWLRVENLPRSGSMCLFSFLDENGRGCFAVLSKDQLIYESISQKQQSISLNVNLLQKRWHYLCLTHTVGRAFSGGSLLRCYVDGVLVSSEKCRYAKVFEVLNACSIGAKMSGPFLDESNTISPVRDSSAFYGQIGPVYLFNDAITSEQVQSIYSLGPSYMYCFMDSDNAVFRDSPLPGGILDPKDGLGPKIIFGLNAQASNGRTLYNVAPLLEHVPDDISFKATVLNGTQLCSRRTLQEIIYCVGGVSVFFPLFTQYDFLETVESKRVVDALPATLIAEVLELIASVLDENLANQQQMQLVSGFSILGLLLQSVPPFQLNLETFSALKHLFNVVANCGLSDVLVEEAISNVFLNPHVWVYTAYKVQRELYMFLIQQLDNDPRMLKRLCKLPHVLDIIRKFYWDNDECRHEFEGKLLLNPPTNQVTMKRPNKEEVQKIRLLLLSLGEMSLRQNISLTDIKALAAYFETSQDMACIEDVLHMVIRAVSQKPLLASFLEQVNFIGGCHIFLNLLEREFEPIRLLGLQFFGRLLVGLPSEKKGLKFFNISVGRSKAPQEGHKKISSRMQPIFSLISDKLFRFPQTDLLCATLFDVLLGGASIKQVLQKYNQIERLRSSQNNSQFFLPQMLTLIFRFLSGSQDSSARIKIISDLLDLLESNPSNTEALLEYGWNAWLISSSKLEALKDYQVASQTLNDPEMNEQTFVKNLYSSVLSYCIFSMKGGWQHLEETANFILVQHEQGGMSFKYFLRDIYEDIFRRLIELSSEENIFISQPCRDNILYLLKLVDEMLISEIDQHIPFPTNSSGFCPDFLELHKHKDLVYVPSVSMQEETSEYSSSVWFQKHSDVDIVTIDERWWHLYDNVWLIISEMNGKGSSKMLPGTSSTSMPSFSQRARGLVESLNIPAAEMAAVVVSGGIGSALAGKPSKTVDRAMLLRGEKCPRIVFRLMILYLCKSSVERASQCVQQVIPLLPHLLTADDDQSKSRLQLFIWSLLAVRSIYGASDDGARFHVISHIIRETLNCSKMVLATSLMGRDESSDFVGNQREPSTIHSLIQKDLVAAAVDDEIKYISSCATDRNRQMDDLRSRLDENMSSDADQRKAFEDEIKINLNSVLASDDTRRASFQLTLEEEQQATAEKWLHTFRSLIDERGPWSANPFPNGIISHWKLDKTEDAWRRRQKLRRNYHFDEKLCQPPSALANTALSSGSESKGSLSSHIPEQMKQFLLKGIRKITDEVTVETSGSHSENGQENAFVQRGLSSSLKDEVVNESSDQKDIEDRKDRSFSSADVGNSEVLRVVPCVLVSPKRKLAGRLAVRKNFLHFFGEFLVEGTGGSSVFKNFDSSGKGHQSKLDLRGRTEKQKINVPITETKALTGSLIDHIDAVLSDAFIKQHKSIKRHRKWSISKIKAVHWTRYLLRYTAIEIFFNDSVAPIFLNFASQKDAKDVGNLIVSTKNEFMYSKGYKDRTGNISFVDRRVAVELAEAARESWRRREITNFEYLMVLNTLAGRSYNDLTQYPVFPWILADYSSESLDFNLSSTFRDLSKPVGALDLKRFEVFEDRYRNFCDPDIPSFYYGSHYSSMGIVLFYLLRLEPYTVLHRNLQGGKFDHADRLFQSIEGTYRNCLSNTSDVKELIPEFFYMPEFLVNLNSYHLGVKQDGEPLVDVLLPPWAKGSPEEFISKNREALESEYVSSNLHHWIDLVFGYKQRGKPAMQAANVFYYLTYESAVDLDAMDDELQRSAIEDQIANFGQTPIQLFRKKHPRRGPPIPIAHPLKFAPASITLTSIISSAISPPSTVLYVNVFDSNILLVNKGLKMSVKIWLTTELHSGGNFTFSSSQDPFFGIGSDIISPRKIGNPLSESIELGAQCFATLQMPSESYLISCGTWENSFHVISLIDGRMVQSIRQHKDIVSCVAVTSDGSILVSGSYDTTVMVWEVIRVRIPDKRSRSAQTEFSRRDCIVADTPSHVLCGHDDIITCLHASVELDIVVSGSKDGTCVFHTLREGRYVRSLAHPSGCSLSKLVVSRHGRIVLYSDDDLSLHLYSINGKHLASCDSNGRLNCVKLSSCCEFLVCAGDQGQIVVRSMNSLEVVRRYSGIGKIITSLTVTPEECFIAGTIDGNLLVFSIENPQLRRTNLPRDLKLSKSLV